MIKSKTWVLWAAWPCAALAQQLPAQTDGAVVFTQPNLWLALFSGLVLAASFQLVLTLLSVATGLRTRVASPSGDNALNQQPSMAGRRGARFGWWLLATASLSLFAATALAANLAAVVSTATGAILGLVIWGLFVIGLAYVESRAVGSAAGFLFRMGAGSFRGAARMARSIAGTQPETERVLSKIRHAVAADLFRPGVWDQLRTYLETLRTSYEEPVVMTRDQAQSYARKLETAAAMATSELSREMVSSRSGGMRDRFKAYGESTAPAKSKPQLNYTAIRNDLLQLMHDPKLGVDALLQRLREVDSDTLRSVLMERDDLSAQEMETLLSHIESARDELIAKAQRMEQEVDRRVKDLRSQAMRQAGDARKQVSRVAAWGVVAATISGAASIIGGIVGAG